MRFVPPGIPLLEYKNGPAPRAHPAGLSIFATSFGNKIEESLPSAASAEEHRAQALTSTVLHAASSDLVPKLRMTFVAHFPGEVGQVGLRGRLRSNSSSKLLHPGRRRRELIARCRRPSGPFSGQPVALAAPGHSRIRAGDLPSAGKP